MAAQEDARDALYKRIVKKAEDANCEELKDLAKSYSDVRYGPQGGQMDYDYSSIVTNKYEDPKKGVGFADA